MYIIAKWVFCVKPMGVGHAKKQSVVLSQQHARRYLLEFLQANQLAWGELGFWV